MFGERNIQIKTSTITIIIIIALIIFNLGIDLITLFINFTIKHKIEKCFRCNVDGVYVIIT